MNTLTLGLLLFTLLSLSASAPHSLPTNNFGAGPNSIAELESPSFFAPGEFMPHAFAFPSNSATGARAAGVTVDLDDDTQNSTLIAEIFSGLQNAQNLTVATAVSEGKLFFGARDTVAAAAGLNSTLALFIANATLLTGLANSSALIHSENSSAYTFAVNSHIQTVASNTKVAQLVLNSTANLILENSAVLLFASGSNIHVVAYNSSVLIANATSNVTVKLHHGSVLTYLNVTEVSGDVSADDVSGENLVDDVSGEDSRSILAPEKMREKTIQATEKVKKFWSKVENFAEEKARKALEKSNNWF